MSNNALSRAITILGSQSLLAEKLGVRQQLISFWLTKSKTGVPAEYVICIESITGIPRHELRPDIYPPSHSDEAA